MSRTQCKVIQVLHEVRLRTMWYDVRSQVINVVLLLFLVVREQVITVFIIIKKLLFRGNISSSKKNLQNVTHLNSTYYIL